MTANPNELGEYLYEIEATFADAVNTYGTKLQTIGRIDPSGLTHEKIALEQTNARPSEGTHDIRGPKGGEFTVDQYLTGHGGTAAAALTATDLYDFMAIVVGGSDATAVGAAVDAAPPPTVNTFTATGIVAPAGALIRVGIPGDGRGNGQFVAVDTEIADAVTLLTDMDAAPNAADQAFAALMIFPSETINTFANPSSIRSRLLTANAQYECHGCVPFSYRLTNLNPTEMPRFETTFGPARHDPANVAFPSGVVEDPQVPAPVISGSLFLNAVGTSTRVTFCVRQFSFETTIAVQLEAGNNPVTDRHQAACDARRLPGIHTLTVMLDKEATGTQTFADLYDTDEQGLAFRHLLMTFSDQDGKSVGLYAPRASLISPMPTQNDLNNLNRVTVTFKLLTGPDTTNDLTLSPWRIAMG